MKTPKTILTIILLFVLSGTTFTQGVAINTVGTDPDDSAMLDVSATNKGVLIPRLTNLQRDAIDVTGNPESLLIFNTDRKCFEFYANGSWHGMGCFECGGTLTINHTTANGVAPENKTVSYGTVSSTLGGTGEKCWITQNLGATNQASSATDATEASAGWYWQFNRKQGYKVDCANGNICFIPSSPAWNSTTDNDSTAWQPSKDPCTIELGAGWRIPTYTEWLNADANGPWANYIDTYASVLKLHAAGYLNSSDGSLGYRGTNGYYWSSVQSDATVGWGLLFVSSYSGMLINDKAYGYSLRCLRD